MNMRGSELIRIPFFVVTSSRCGGLLVRWMISLPRDRALPLTIVTSIPCVLIALSPRVAAEVRWVRNESSPVASEAAISHPH